MGDRRRDVKAPYEALAAEDKERFEPPMRRRGSTRREAAKHEGGRRRRRRPHGGCRRRAATRGSLLRRRRRAAARGPAADAKARNRCGAPPAGWASEKREAPAGSYMLYVAGTGKRARSIVEAWRVHTAPPTAEGGPPRRRPPASAPARARN